MATGWQTFPVEFKGGLISNLSPLQQGMNAVGSATILQNFEPTREGGYKKVLGYSKYSTQIVPGTGPLLGVKIINGSSSLAIRADTATGRSQYWRSTGGAWTSVSLAALAGSKVRGISYNFGTGPKLLFVDGANAPALYDSLAGTMSYLTGVTDALGATQVVAYKQTIFFAKGTNLIFGAPYSDTDFTPASGGGIINVAREITGIVVFRDQLIIFSRQQIQRLVGSTASDFQLVPITENIGCIYPDTIQEVGGDIMFLGPDGLRLLSATERIGDFGLEIASAPITKDAERFLSTGSDFTSLTIRNKAQYRIFKSDASTSVDSSEGFIAVKFSDQGASRIEWATLSGFKVLCADSRYTAVGVAEEIVIFGNDSGYVYLMESGNSRDGANISSVFQAPFMPITDPQKRKTLYKMALYIDTIGAFDIGVTFLFDIFKVDNYNGNVLSPTIRLANDAGGGVFFYGTPTAIYGVATYASDVDKVYDTPVIGSGKTFSFRIEDISTNAAFTLDTAVFEFKEHDRQ